MSAIDTLHFPRRRVPDPNKVVIASSHDGPAVRQPGYGLNPLLEARIAIVDDILSGLGVQCLHLALVMWAPSSQHKTRPPGRPCHSEDAAGSIIGVDGASQVWAIAWLRHLPVRQKCRLPCQEATACRQCSQSSQFE